MSPSQSKLDEATARDVLASMVAGAPEPMLRGAAVSWALAEVAHLRRELRAIAEAHPLTDAERLRQYAGAAIGDENV